MGRFLNADSVLGQTGELLTHNLFAYCGNNPVMGSDPGGNIATIGSGDLQEEARLKKNLSIYNKVKRSKLGKNIRGSFEDYTYVAKEVYSGVFETLMSSVYIDRSNGVAVSITTYTIISGGRDDIKKYADYLNTSTKIYQAEAAIIIAELGLIPGVDTVAIPMGAVVSIGGAVMPGPGDSYINYGYTHPKEQYLTFVIDMVQSGGCSNGSSGIITFANGFTYRW